VRQRQSRSGPHVLGLDDPAAVPRGVRDRCARGDQVGPHAVDAEGGTHLGHLPQRTVGEHDLGQQRLGPGDPLAQRGLVVRPAPGEGLGVGLERQSAFDHVHADGRVTAGRHLDGQTEAVEQLWPQLALLGVHRADEHEARCVRGRDTLSLDGRSSHCGRVEQHVDQVVTEQVDFVDIQQPSVSGGQQAGLVGGDALGEGPLQVQRAKHAVLGGAHWQLDQPGGAGGGGGSAVMHAIGAAWVRHRRVAREAAAIDHRDIGQQGRERAHHGRLGGAFLAAYQHPADGR